LNNAVVTAESSHWNCIVLRSQQNPHIEIAWCCGHSRNMAFKMPYAKG